MNRQIPPHAVKIAKSPEVLAFESEVRGEVLDPRERDRTPGRFTVKGSFIDLAGSETLNYELLGWTAISGS